MSEKKRLIPPWVKELFFKFGSSVITKGLVRIGLKMVGPVGWVASFFIDWVLKKAWPVVVRVVVGLVEKKETAKELKDYGDKINKPDATAEEIKDAGKDMLSS